MKLLCRVDGLYRSGSRKSKGKVRGWLECDLEVTAGPWARPLPNPSGAPVPGAPSRPSGLSRHPRRSSREAPAATVVANIHPTSTRPAAAHCQPPSIRQ